jgi:nickel-dependent lactate racemase
VRGTRASLNRLIFERDLVVTISAVNAHYFAGFGGGRKSIFPGIAGRDGIIANHLLAVDFERGRMADGVETGRLDGNPLNEDICEIVSRRPPDFSINTLLNPAGGIGALYCGHWLEAHRAACGRFMEHHAVPIPERRAWAIVSCGGHPKDIDLIQSHKTIQYASRALSRGGIMLLFARCDDGLGSSGFEAFFPIREVTTLLADIRDRNPKNGQTALALHQKTRELNIGLVSALAPALVRDMGMEPFANAQEGISWLRAGAGAADGYCIPHGAVTLPWEG